MKQSENFRTELVNEQKRLFSFYKKLVNIFTDNDYDWDEVSSSMDVDIINTETKRYYVTQFSIDDDYKFRITEISAGVDGGGDRWNDVIDLSLPQNFIALDSVIFALVNYIVESDDETIKSALEKVTYYKTGKYKYLRFYNDIEHYLNSLLPISEDTLKKITWDIELRKQYPVHGFNCSQNRYGPIDNYVYDVDNILIDGYSRIYRSFNTSIAELLTITDRINMCAVLEALNEAK